MVQLVSLAWSSCWFRCKQLCTLLVVDTHFISFLKGLWVAAAAKTRSLHTNENQFPVRPWKHQDLEKG